MAPLIRLAAVLFFALLLYVTVGGVVHAASVARVDQSCGISQTQAPVGAVASDSAEVWNAATTAQDCQSGKCSGSNCHCSCHGLVAALPVPASGLPRMPIATHARPGPQYFAAVTLLPPVPPPQA